MSAKIIDKISGKAVPVRGDDIDTDRIIPARFLRCVTFDGLGEHAFEDDKAQDPNHPFNQEKYQQASILFAGKNFGCGSSREHAPQSLQKWGIEGIVGLSFAEIFFGNCNAMGIPCLTVNEAEIEVLFQEAEANPDQEFSIDVETGIIRFGNKEIQAKIHEGAQNSFLKGTWNATAVLLEAEDEIEATAKELPYFTNFA